MVRVIFVQHKGILGFRLTWGNIDVAKLQKVNSDSYMNCGNEWTWEYLTFSCRNTVDTGAENGWNIGHNGRTKIIQQKARLGVCRASMAATTSVGDDTWQEL